MANYSFNWNDANTTRLEDAFDTAYPGRTAAGRTRKNWVEDQLKLFAKNVMRGVEADAAENTARNAKIAEIDGLTL